MEPIKVHLVSGQVLILLVGLDIVGYLRGAQDTVVKFSAGDNSLVCVARCQIINVHFSLV